MKYNSDQAMFKMADEFCIFMEMMWKFHGLDKVAPLDKVDYEIAEWLQYAPPLAIVAAFRGQGKSYKTNCYTAWEAYQARVLHDQKLFALLVSASEGHAIKNLHSIRHWYRSTPWLAPLYPKTERDAATTFDLIGSNEKFPTMTAAGITGQITGNRADLIVPDDVETMETALTITQRAYLREKFKELIAILLKGGRIRLLMTPQHAETLAADLTSQEIEPKYRFAIRSWPAKYPNAEDRKRILGLAPRLDKDLQDGIAQPGDPTCPARFDLEDLAMREAQSGRSKWCREYMLHISGSELIRYPLKLADLIVHPVNPTKAPVTIQWGRSNHNGSTALDIPSAGLGDDRYYAPIYVDEQWQPYHSSKMFIDTAGLGADETAWCSAGMLHGNIFIKGLGAYDDGHTTENLDRIASDAKRYHINDITIESQFGGEMFKQLLIPRIERISVKPGEDPAYPQGWGCYVHCVPARGQKEARIIDTIEPALNQHRVVMDPEVANDSTLGQQMTQLTRQPRCLDHDDRIEVLAGVVGLFTDSLDRDAEGYQRKIAAEKQAKEIADWSKRHQVEATGPGWCHY